MLVAHIFVVFYNFIGEVQEFSFRAAQKTLLAEFQHT